MNIHSFKYMVMSHYDIDFSYKAIYLKLESFEFIFIGIKLLGYAVDNDQLLFLFTQFVIHLILIFLHHSEQFLWEEFSSVRYIFEESKTWTMMYCMKNNAKLHLKSIVVVCCMTHSVWTTCPSHLTHHKCCDSCSYVYGCISIDSDWTAFMVHVMFRAIVVFDYFNSSK